MAGEGAGGSAARFAYAALLLMALAAAIVLGTDVSNYVRSVKSGRGLRLEIADLQVIDDGNPRALLRFRVRNDSPLEIEIVRYGFELYLNEQRVGGSYSTYLGTDPGVDAGTHREAGNVNQTLAPDQELDLEYTLYIYAAQMEIVRQAQRSAPMFWYAKAEFTTILPHSRRESAIGLQAGFEE